jgi:hypothetical protein
LSLGLVESSVPSIESFIAGGAFLDLRVTDRAISAIDRVFNDTLECILCNVQSSRNMQIEAIGHRPCRCGHEMFVRYWPIFK